MILKQLKEFPDYYISDCGKIMNKEGKERKFQINEDGYYVINLMKDGVDYHRRRARLLAQHFIPNPNNLPIVNHIDHTRTNDSLDNLEWVTYKENNTKSVEMHPERWKHLALVGVDQVHEICSLIEQGTRNSEIVKMLGVSLDTVKHIRTGATWTEISCDYKMQGSRKGISDTTAAWVCHRVKEGLSNKEILGLSECDRLSRDIVKKIRNGVTWKRISKDIL